MKITVTCYSGYRGEEKPRSFTIGSREHPVKDIIDAWYGPDYRYFKVVDSADNIYILRNNERDDTWEIHFFDKTRY